MSNKNFSLSLNSGAASVNVVLVLPTNAVPVPVPVPVPVSTPVPVIQYKISVGYGSGSRFTSIDEGRGITWLVEAPGMQSGTLYYTNVGTTSAKDFLDGTNSGPITIVNERGEFNKILSSDELTEIPNNETIIMQLRTGSINGTVVATSETITVNDTSKTAVPANPTYSITPDKTQVNEGESVIFTVVSSDGIIPACTREIVPVGVPNVNSVDFDTSLTASILRTTSPLRITIPIKRDITTEGGLEQFKVVLRQTRTGLGGFIGIGSVELCSSTPVTINDTSTSPIRGSRLFTASGQFELPVGITTYTIKASGGGGGGGSYHGECSGQTKHPGSDGGAGYIQEVTRTVNPTDIVTLYFTVGRGGTGGTGTKGSDGIDGSASIVTNTPRTGIFNFGNLTTLRVVAAGGLAGKEGSGGPNGAGGNGSPGGAGGKHRDKDFNGKAGSDGYVLISWSS